MKRDHDQMHNLADAFDKPPYVSDPTTAAPKKAKGGKGAKVGKQAE